MSAPIRDQFRAMLVEQIKPAFHVEVPQQRQVLDGRLAAADWSADGAFARGRLGLG